MSEYNLSAEASQSLEPLTDKNIGNLSAAIGNHEGKALLMVGLANAPADATFGRTGLHKLIHNLPGAEGTYAGNVGNQLDWCSNTLAPIGLVAKSDYASPLMYAATEEGKGIGKAFAGLMLEFSDDINMPLLTLMGATHTRGTIRSPETRLGIARALVEADGSVALTQLMEKLRPGGSLSSQLDTMATDRLLQYAKKNLNEDLPSYSLETTEYKPRAGGVYTPLLLECLQTSGSTTSREIVDFISEKWPQGVEKPPTAKIRGNVHVLMGALLRKGVVSKSGFMEAETHGMLSLDESQRTLWADLINRIDALKTQNPNTLHHYQRVADEFARDPQRVKSALTRASSSAILSNDGSEKRAAVLVSGILHESAGPLAVREIVEKIRDQYGRTLSTQSVRTVLKPLVESGEISQDPGVRRPLYEVVRPTSTD